MFSKVLVANRGEIAVRVIRACRELGLQTVAVYSQADAKAGYLRFADETICIGKASSADSYLSIPNVLAAAEIAAEAADAAKEACSAASGTVTPWGAVAAGGTATAADP